MSDLSPAAKAIQDVRGDFEVYAPLCMHILTKSGSLLPLELNSAQLIVHSAIEKQLAETGKVRAIILKGRQQGISTYVEARFYWKLTGTIGSRAFILTHLDEATTNLFNMTKRYNDNCPPGFRPHTRLDNAKELYFDRLDCRYSVSTAGSSGTGRSATAQFLHGSEVAMWQHASQHMAGIGQVIPDEPGTEIILESTALGVGNVYHQKWLDAIEGKGEYIAIFVPWFVQREYRKRVPANVEWEAEELEYQDAFGLDNEQMYWRRLKIVDDFSGDNTLFDQEYPGTPEMAFLAGSKDSFISALAVVRAQKIKTGTLSSGATVIGVDPAEYGDDDTAIVIRKGRKVLRVIRYSKENGEQIAGRVAILIDEYEPEAVNVDVTGVGTAVEQFLTAAGYKNIYRVNNGAKALEPERFVNKACEMWWNMKEFIDDELTQLPRDAKLQSDLVGRKYSYDPRRRFKLESKEDMKKRGLKSPDSADALALTFATPIKPRADEHEETLIQKLARVRGHTGSARGDDGMGA